MVLAQGVCQRSATWDIWFSLTTCLRKQATGINAAGTCGLSDNNFCLYKHCILSGSILYFPWQCLFNDHKWSVYEAKEKKVLVGEGRVVQKTLLGVIACSSVYPRPRGLLYLGIPRGALLLQTALGPPKNARIDELSALRGPIQEQMGRQQDAKIK